MSQIQSHLHVWPYKSLECKPQPLGHHTTQTTFLGFGVNQQGIVMDPAKLKDVLESKPTILVFANFYCRFIWNYSSGAAPPKTMSVWCGSGGILVTEKVNHLSSQLHTPRSTTAISHWGWCFWHTSGAVLSQRTPSDQNLHPCASFSRWVIAAKRNYNVRNRQLLAIKVALEEWGHWLKGAQHPFIVFEYI